MTKSVDPVEPQSNILGQPRLYRVVYEKLLDEIKTGTYRPGERLPSEAVLCERFNTSRITIARALQILQRDGVVNRRAGSGSFVELPKSTGSLQFGLLIPDLGRTEIFDPICNGIMRSPAGEQHSLIWGHASATEGKRIEDAERLCKKFIQQKVAGVFFAPIEYLEGDDDINARLVSSLQAENIPVVMLDRTYEPYPLESSVDLVGIDNYRAGFVLAYHLGQQGARRIVFVARRRSANTVFERIDGYKAAIRSLKHDYEGHVFFGDVEDEGLIAKMLAEERPDGIVCGNDMTAAKLMRTLIDLGKRIPDDIRMVGVDDVSFARYLPVPLTTIHQNCDLMGHMAMMLMLDRLRNPKRSPVQMHVGFELVVRESCGTRHNST